jgi:hypothetical protein
MRATAAIRAAIVAALLSGAGGCYRGAIYASYEEVGLGIKATAESNSPVKVHFGYNRGVGAWVPRRGGADEEATSLISRDDVRANVNPTKLGQPLLQVDGAVIAGTAAIVAAAPANAVVEVKDADAVEAAATQVSVATRGGPGARIGMALAQTDLTEDEVAVLDLIKLIRLRPDRDTVFDAAATSMPTPFRNLYGKRRAASASPTNAFRGATSDYLSEEGTDVTARNRELRAALGAAIKE